MERVLKGFALLGMAWTGVLILFWIWLSLSKGVDLFFLGLCLLLLLVCWRCYHLHRWAAVGLCVYCLGMTLLDTGIWQWQVGWTLIALLLATVIVCSWPRLKRGL